MAMEKQLDTDVIIIGAGSTGLLLAQGLRTAGIPFRIFERYGKDHVSREWSMSLHWGGQFLTKILPDDLRNRLEEINTDPDHDFSKDPGFAMCNGETGEILLAMPGDMPRRVSRRKLRSLLGEGINIEHDKKLSDLTPHGLGTALPTVTVTFSDDSKVTARLVVGCDGSRSRTRQLLMSDVDLGSARPVPYTMMNFPWTYPSHLIPELREIHPVFKVGYHPKLPCMYMTSVLETRFSTGDMMFQNFLSWTGPPTVDDFKADPSLAHKHLQELGAQFATPFRVAAANVPSDAPIWVDQGTRWDPRSYFQVIPSSESALRTTSWNGNSMNPVVTLAGDAAHTLLPWRGQGLNHALEDAARLVEELTGVYRGEKNMPEAITAYEEEMLARSGSEMDISDKTAIAAHDFNLLMQGPMFKHGVHKVKPT